MFNKVTVTRKPAVPKRKARASLVTLPRLLINVCAAGNHLSCPSPRYTIAQVCYCSVCAGFLQLAAATGCYRTSQPKTSHPDSLPILEAWQLRSKEKLPFLSLRF